MKTNVLGQDYDIIIDDTLKDKNKDGECLMYEKEIHIRAAQDMLEPDASMRSKVKSQNETLRHELMHAFFFEAGLVEYCSDETLVDFIAQQFPKLHKIFSETGCVM